jgi:hypothetical protein
MEYYSVIKKNEFISFAEKWKELEIILLRKICQSQKFKYHIFHSSVGSKPKVMIMIVMMIMIKIIIGHEYKRKPEGDQWGTKRRGYRRDEEYLSI